ncbi:polysaccharide lyase family 8 protein [Epithele typhae]|uniref:polysaccharide lyase family 8 protein n=1 Tax=Epithele typhae TaxID=378194 RepID=UPI00200800DC|nr:polysaccharide lyase family 8 protein [Epithele typhae]KAH9918355.1 polysaccharide lyase family 8 protein [Epithele typhae]
MLLAVFASLLVFLPLAARSLPSFTHALPNASVKNSQGLSPRDVDFSTMRSRRVALAIGAINTTLVPEIDYWLDTLNAEGKWPDSEVNYATGCDGRRANWPAEEHWVRIETLAAAWRGGVPGADAYVNSSTVLSTASRAMDFWFANDMPNLDCLYSGGSGQCPCGTPASGTLTGFQTYAALAISAFVAVSWAETDCAVRQVIAVPVLIGDTCLILGNTTLSDTQYGNCTNILERSFGTFASGQGFLAGANILDIAKCGITAALLAENSTGLADAYGHVHREVVVHDATFGQHTGIIYNGNYGKDYSNDVIALEITAGGTEFAAGDDSKSAFETLMDGNLWMIYKNIKTSILHWDFSVTGRMITFAVSDEQATSSILINTTLLAELGQLWGSDIISSAASQLTSDTDNANVGSMNGNRMFYDNDYMVHRGDGYVTTLRMYSSRTANTECVNVQNTVGFHLADGTVYTYLEGDEYEDIAGMWDWNLIPGITTDYGNTPLSCGQTEAIGTEAFVGGASDGTIGAARCATRTRLQAPVVPEGVVLPRRRRAARHALQPLLPSSAPVFSVLDQKRHSGPVLLDGAPLAHGGNFTHARTLWHDGVGYAFPPPARRSRSTGARARATGARSESPPRGAVRDLFSAWVASRARGHGVLRLPRDERGAFRAKAAKAAVTLGRAVYDGSHHVAAAVFWDGAGGNVTFTPGLGRAPVAVSVQGGAIVVYRLDKGKVTVADPTQTLSNVEVTLEVVGPGKKPTGSAQNESGVSVALPSGGAGGKSVTTSLRDVA